MDPYKKSGVDVTAGYESVKRMKKHIERTSRPEVLTEVGGFGGLFDLSKAAYQEPVLVSGTDGVGTKLLLAIEQGIHHTIGIDCVAMCVNDVIAQGATPLFFLDYIATSQVKPDVVEQLVAGVAEGCVQSGAALIGGETAEMPDMYQAGHYDLAGFTVGIGEKSQLIQKENIQAGDVLIGLPSSGVHSNGFSLVRQIFFKDHDFSYDHQFEELAKPLGEELLTPTKIYVETLKPLLEKQLIQGISHITGGGFIENIPRMLPDHLAAQIIEGSWPILPIFDVLQQHGKLTLSEMYGIFNLGIGMVLAVSKENQAEVCQVLAEHQEPYYVIGQVIPKETESIVFQATN